MTRIIAGLKIGAGRGNSVQVCVCVCCRKNHTVSSDRATMHILWAPWLRHVWDNEVLLETTWCGPITRYMTCYTYTDLHGSTHHLSEIGPIWTYHLTSLDLLRPTWTLDSSPSILERCSSSLTLCPNWGSRDSPEGTHGAVFASNEDSTHFKWHRRSPK